MTTLRRSLLLGRAKALSLASACLILKLREGLPLEVVIFRAISLGGGGLSADTSYPATTATIEEPALHGKRQIEILIGEAVGTGLGKIFPILVKVGNHHRLEEFGITAHIFSEANKTCHTKADAFYGSTTAINLLDIYAWGKIIQCHN
jgi:hypothetical protein